MAELKLLPGPVLERKTWVYDESTSKGAWATSVVTNRSIEFLFKEIEVDPAVTLHDVFRLIGMNEHFLPLYQEEFVTELMAEVDKGAVLPAGLPHERIEYLELYQTWNLDSDTKECSSVGRFQLHGIGYVLEEDVTEEGSAYVYHHKGQRINWGVSLTPVRELLHLPIRVNSKVSVCEDNLDLKAYGDEIQTVLNDRITLGTFIREILWELSWHGAPNDSAKVLDELKDQVEEVQAGTAKTIPCDDVFESLGATSQKATNAHFFLEGPNFSSAEVYRATHALEDNLLAKVGLKLELEGRLVLKPEHEHLTGKELRKAMREFRWDSRHATASAKA